MSLLVGKTLRPTSSLVKTWLSLMLTILPTCPTAQRRELGKLLTFRVCLKPCVLRAQGRGWSRFICVFLKSQHTEKAVPGHLGKPGSMICVQVQFVSHGQNPRVWNDDRNLTASSTKECGDEQALGTAIIHPSGGERVALIGQDENQ